MIFKNIQMIKIEMVDWMGEKIRTFSSMALLSMIKKSTSLEKVIIDLRYGMKEETARSVLYLTKEIEGKYQLEGYIVQFDTYNEKEWLECIIFRK